MAGATIIAANARDRGLGAALDEAGRRRTHRRHPRGCGPRARGQPVVRPAAWRLVPRHGFLLLQGRCRALARDRRLLPAASAQRPIHRNADGRQPVSATRPVPVRSRSSCCPRSSGGSFPSRSSRAFLVWCRPGPIAWPCSRSSCVAQRTQTAFLFGNTDLWMAAAVAGGIRWGWPAALLVIKPTFLVLAIVGVRRREFWIALAVSAIVSIPMAALWVDYVQAMRN